MAIYHRHKQGKASEEAACRFLQERGLIFITKNFHTRFGEIDLIMQENNIIVFVEVRSKRQSLYGNALESIVDEKTRKLEATATLFLQQQGWLNNKTARFDVVAIDIHDNTMQFDWIKNAF